MCVYEVLHSLHKITRTTIVFLYIYLYSQIHSSDFLTKNYFAYIIIS